MIPVRKIVVLVVKAVILLKILVYCTGCVYGARWDSEGP